LAITAEARHKRLISHTMPPRVKGGILVGNALQ
jgi:hypothetical protein